MPSIIRRIRTRLPTCLSIGLGSFVAISASPAGALPVAQLGEQSQPSCRSAPMRYRLPVSLWGPLALVDCLHCKVDKGRRSIGALLVRLKRAGDPRVLILACLLYTSDAADE